MPSISAPETKQKVLIDAIFSFKSKVLLSVTYF